MKKLENGLTIIESFTDMEALYKSGKLDGNDVLGLYTMAGMHTRYCIGEDFWRKLKNKIDLGSNDRSILCRLNNELVKISYSDPRYTILRIMIQRVKIYDVHELE